jgi:hypothetical protein
MTPLRAQGRAVLRLDHKGHDTARAARGSSAKRDDVDVARVMRRSGNKIELKLDKGRGLHHPEKVQLIRHQKPLRHLPAVAGGKTGECVDALDRLGMPPNTTRDESAEVLTLTVTSSVTRWSVRRKRAVVRPRILGRQALRTTRTAVQRTRPPSGLAHHPLGR